MSLLSKYFHLLMFGILFVSAAVCLILIANALFAFFSPNTNIIYTLTLNTTDLKLAADQIRTKATLTVSSPSATLFKEEEKPKITAEVTNTSNVSGQAQTIADNLEKKGIEIVKISSSQNGEQQSAIFIKKKYESLVDTILSEFRAKENVVVKTLDEDYPVDIRIVVGR